MPRTRRPDPLYQRGHYRLFPREGRNLEIVRYDGKRERCVSAGTKDPDLGRIALDKLYLKETGGEYIPPTSRVSPIAAAVIADYLTAKSDQAASQGAIAHRLRHITNYLGTLRNKEVRCEQIDEAWIGKFREWLKKQPVVGNGWKAAAARERSPATIENSVLQLAAAISWARQIPNFKPIPLPEVTRSPQYRADIPMLAAMFRYAMKPRRQNLLAFLRLSVATWGRPDAIMDASTQRGQWASQARVFSLNPVGRRQTKKRRATVPVPQCVADWLDTIDGPVVPKEVSKATWRRMQAELGIPFDGQGGMKLIRRSVSTLARSRLGEEHWVQGRLMLGHVPMTVSDIYAIPDPANLGKALAVTESIIEEINELSPGGFYRKDTAMAGNVVSIGRGNSPIKTKG